jgi:hypothetical protein
VATGAVSSWSVETYCDEARAVKAVSPKVRSETIAQDLQDTFKLDVGS